MVIINMSLTQEDVDKLKAIHEKEAGEKLSDDEAWAMATRLLELSYLLTESKSQDGQF